ERIFQEFQQLDAGPGRRFEGSGLGLALTRRFVGMHGGSVRLASAPGKGSRFTVELPLTLAPRPVEDVPVPPPIAADAAAPLVLVVENDPQAADLLTAYLALGSYRSAVATDGEQALELARALHPLAITLDLLLPTLDGWEVLRALKLDPGTRDIPVMMVSVVDDQHLGYALGAVDYFVKPVDREALLARLARHARDEKLPRREVRVLAIDDDPRALALTTGTLESAGYRVLQAGGGAEGIRLAEREHPNLILLDLMMPDVSGFDVVRAVRENPATHDIPILVVTAKELTVEDKDALNA